MNEVGKFRKKAGVQHANITGLARYSEVSLPVILKYYVSVLRVILKTSEVKAKISPPSVSGVNLK